MVLLAPGGHKLAYNKQGTTLAVMSSVMSSVDVISDVIS